MTGPKGTGKPFYTEEYFDNEARSIRQNASFRDWPRGLPILLDRSEWDFIKIKAQARNFDAKYFSPEMILEFRQEISI